MSTSTLDYGQMYDQYWVRPDRWGTHSFTDPEVLVQQISRTCGDGPMLDVGCGMGLLVETPGRIDIGSARSAILAAKTGAVFDPEAQTRRDCIISADNGRKAVEYAQLNFGEYGCEFQMSKDRKRNGGWRL